MPFRILKLGDYSSTNIESCIICSSEHEAVLYPKTTLEFEKDLEACNRQVGYMNHIVNYRHRTNNKPPDVNDENIVHFVISNSKNFIEIEYNHSRSRLTAVRKMEKQVLEKSQKIWNNGGIVPQRINVDISTEGMAKETIEQYFFVD